MTPLVCLRHQPGKHLLTVSCFFQALQKNIDPAPKSWLLGLEEAFEWYLDYTIFGLPPGDVATQRERIETTNMQPLLRDMATEFKRLFRNPCLFTSAEEWMEYTLRIRQYLRDIRSAAEAWEAFEAYVKEDRREALLNRLSATRLFPVQMQQQPWEPGFKNYPVAFVPRPATSPPYLAAEAIFTGGTRLFERWEVSIRSMHARQDTVSVAPFQQHHFFSHGLRENPTECQAFTPHVCSGQSTALCATTNRALETDLFG
jgi:hypothetical protein